MEKDIFSSINKTAVIKRIPIFSNLSNNELDFISEKSKIIEYKKDEKLYLENDPPDAFYCIINGRIKVHTSSQEGKENILGILHRGEYFGIISLLTGEPHSVTTTAINDSILLKIDKANFEVLLKKIPSLAIRLSQTLSRRIKSKDNSPKTIFESHIVSIYSISKGVGRTTYAANLSLSLRNETDKRVILLNISPFHKEISKLFGILSKRDLSLRDIRRDPDYIKSRILNHNLGIDLLNIVHEPKDNKDKEFIIPLLVFLANEYHFIIVDLSFQMGEAVFKTLIQSDYIHIITDCSNSHIELASRLIGELNKSIQNVNDKIKVIINEARPDEALTDKQRKAILKHNIYATLPEIKSLDENREYLEDKPIVIKEPTSDYSRVIRRISRDLGNVLVGLALGSGAALGLAQIGIIKVIEKEGIPIDCVVGSSIGSLIGAFWASGKSAFEIKQITLSFKNRLATLKLMDPAVPRSGLINGDEVVSFLKTHLGNKTFCDVRFPFKVVASDIYNREIVVLDNGSLVDAVRISVSIPGIFVPVRQNNSVLIDGGILDPIPVDALIKMGIRRIIAVDTLPSPEDIQRTNAHQEELAKKLKEKRSFLKRIKYYFKSTAKRLITPNIFDIIVNSIQAMEYSLGQSYLQQADVVLKPRLIDINWYELFHADKLINLGEEEAIKKLPQIKKLISE